VEIPFIKIEGLGNDYIFVDQKSLGSKRVKPGRLAREISHRQFGVGSDGLIVMQKLGPLSAQMSIYNADGSEAEFCGNGLRGTALYMKSVYKAKGNEFAISTKWSEHRVKIKKISGNKGLIEALIGAPSFDAADVGYTGQNCMGVKIQTSEAERTLYCVAMPNPQAVIFVDNFDFEWKSEGRFIETNPLFKNAINVMFVKVISEKKLSLMPWERGSGPTLACGSGAAAATVISNLLEYTRVAISVQMPGGSLSTRWEIKNNRVYQQGPSRIVFSGKYII
jgi:diaminopimelate epimerase